MKCLRCGRELKSKASFCPECSVTTAVPLEESPYLLKRISIPVRKPAQKSKKPEAKKSRQSVSRPRMLVCILACLLCIVLLLQLVYLFRDLAAAHGEISRLQSVEDECVLLTEKLRQAQARILALEERLALEAAP